jgi:hypothetical protein
MTGAMRLAILLLTSRTERWYRWIGERFSQVGSQQRSERPISLEARKLKELGSSMFVMGKAVWIVFIGGRL